jgi:hypothetical protein
MPNIFGFNAHMYAPDVTHELRCFEASEDGALGSVIMSFEGRIKRLKSKITVKRTIDGDKKKIDVEVPPGGEVKGTRIFGVDFTRASGADALVVIADRISGAEKAPRQWVLHAGFKTAFTTSGNTFTIEYGDARLRGRALLPPDLTFTGVSNPPWTNFIHAETMQNEVQVVMTLERGDPVEISAPPEGLREGVTAGERRIQLAEDRIIFSRVAETR